jgi:hypothetical protein
VRAIWSVSRYFERASPMGSSTDQRCACEGRVPIAAGVAELALKRIGDTFVLNVGLW